MMLPMAVGVMGAFANMVSEMSIFSGMLGTLEKGVLCYLLFHIFIARPVYIYVLGHEVVHVLATWICGGKVTSFKVSPAGGNVVTSKTNFFIELSPYFVPLYTVLIVPIFVMLRYFEKGGPHLSEIFLFMVGVTLTFHFVMTFEILKAQQQDIAKSGAIFSLVTILIANIIVITAVFSPFFDQISFVGFIKDSASRSVGIYQTIYYKITGLVDYFRS